MHGPVLGLSYMCFTFHGSYLRDGCTRGNGGAHRQSVSRMGVGHEWQSECPEAAAASHEVGARSSERGLSWAVAGEFVPFVVLL